MPDFRFNSNFPISSVIDAAQRNNQLQEQAREAGNRSIIEGLQSIGQVGQSLFDQKVKVAQALAGAHMMAVQNPELVGDNQVTQTPQGPVTQNQTAAYDPTSGTVTPSRPPMDTRTIATALYGASPKDLLEHMTQSQAAKTAQGRLALEQKIEPQKVAIEGRKALAEEENAKVSRLIQGMLAANTVKNESQQRTQAAENAAFEADKEAAKHYILHPQLASQAQARIAQGEKGTALPEVGKTVVHPSGVKITRTK